jgi:hypothetical protein
LEILFLVVLGVVGAYGVWRIFGRLKSGAQKPDLYICSHCGEKNCDCYKQENK